MKMLAEIQKGLIQCQESVEELRERAAKKSYDKSGYQLRSAVRVAFKKLSIGRPMALSMEERMKGTKFRDMCLKMIPTEHHKELRGLDDVGHSWLSITLADMLTSFPLHRSVQVEPAVQRNTKKIRSNLCSAIWTSAMNLVLDKSKIEAAAAAAAAGHDDSDGEQGAPAAKVMRRDPTEVNASEMEYLTRLGCCAIFAEETANTNLNSFLAYMQLVAIAAAAAGSLGWGTKGEHSDIHRSRPSEILDKMMPKVDNASDRDAQTDARRSCVRYAAKYITPGVTGDFVTFVQMVIQQRTSVVLLSSAAVDNGISDASSAAKRAASTNMDCDSREHATRFYVLKKALADDQMLKLYLPSLLGATDFAEYQHTLVGDTKAAFAKALKELAEAPGADGSEESFCRFLVPKVDSLTTLKRKMFDRTALEVEPGNIYWWRDGSASV